MTCTIISNREELKIKCKNEKEQPYKQIKMKLKSVIRNMILDGCCEFYVNSERGIPLFAAEELCSMKKSNPDLRVNIVIPYENQSVNWPEELRDRYFSVHEMADSVKTAEKHYSEDSYNIADEIMLNDSDLLLVFGSPSDNLYAVEYAEKNNVRVGFIELPAFAE